MRFLPAWQEQRRLLEVRYARREGDGRAGCAVQHVYRLRLERIVLPIAFSVLAMLEEISHLASTFGEILPAW